MGLDVSGKGPAEARRKLKNCFLDCGPVSISPGSLLELQTLYLHSRPTGSELAFNKVPGQFVFDLNWKTLDKFGTELVWGSGIGDRSKKKKKLESCLSLLLTEKWNE